MGSALAPISAPALDTARNAAPAGPQSRSAPSAQVGKAKSGSEPDQPDRSSQTDAAFQFQTVSSDAIYFSRSTGSSSDQRGVHGERDGKQGYQVPDAVVLASQLRAIAAGDGTTHPAPPSPSAASADGPLDLKSEENRLQAALQSMGLSPGVIQEFMYVGKVLAEVAPGVFQNFVAQMVNLADAEQSASAPGSGESHSAPGATPGPASISPAEDVSIQMTTASVTVSKTAQGVTLNVAAETESLNVAFAQTPQNGGDQSTVTGVAALAQAAGARAPVPTNHHKPQSPR